MSPRNKLLTSEESGTTQNEASKNASLTVRPREGFPLIPMIHRYLRSKPETIFRPPALMLSRRNFLTTAAVASVGTLVVTPLTPSNLLAGPAPMPDFVSELGRWVSKLAQGILLGLIASGPSVIPIFGSLVKNAGESLQGMEEEGATKEGVYGSTKVDRQIFGWRDTTRTAGIVGDILNNSLRGIWQGPTLYALANLATTAFMQKLLSGKKAQGVIGFIEKYMLPALGTASTIARAANLTMLSRPLSIIESFLVPQIYDTEEKGIIVSDYKTNVQRSGHHGRYLSGIGTVEVFSVPNTGGRAAFIRQTVKKEPYILDNRAALDSFMNKVRGQAENNTEAVNQYKLKFDT